MMREYIVDCKFLGIRILMFAMIAFALLGSTSCRSRKHKKDFVPETELAIRIDHGRAHKKLRALEKRLVDEAMTWEGTPYKYAGSEKGKGTDCSGMVLKVYQDAADIKLPRNSRKQAEFCKTIKQKEVRPGDLVFFATGKDPNVISHVGIMLDGVRFIHASSKKGVLVSDMHTPYYQRKFIMYGVVPGVR